MCVGDRSLPGVDRYSGRDGEIKKKTSADERRNLVFDNSFVIFRAVSVRWTSGLKRDEALLIKTLATAH